MKIMGNIFKNLIQINRLENMLSLGSIVGRTNQKKAGEGNGNISVLHFWSDNVEITQELHTLTGLVNLLCNRHLNTSGTINMMVMGCVRQHEVFESQYTDID
jgi:hypothetical protein